MRKIILANGQEYEVTMCGEAERTLWLQFPDKTMTFKKLLNVFGKAENTERITHTYDTEGRETVFEGYTDLFFLQRDIYEGTYKIALLKEVRNN